MKDLKNVELILRIGIAGEFLGHGVFALEKKAGWIKYFEAVGISADGANAIMPLIGGMDVFFAILVLVWPVRAALLWMAIWGMWTALLRPIGGDPIWDFVERWANWAAPLSLLFLYGWPKSLREWFGHSRLK